MESDLLNKMSRRKSNSSEENKSHEPQVFGETIQTKETIDESAGEQTSNDETASVSFDCV